MQTTTLEVTEIQEETENDDIVHVVCNFCTPDKPTALCGSDCGGVWVVSAPPEDECIVCIDLEKTHICKDGFNWGDADNVD